LDLKDIPNRAFLIIFRSQNVPSKSGDNKRRLCDNQDDENDKENKTIFNDIGGKKIHKQLRHIDRQWKHQTTPKKSWVFPLPKFTMFLLKWDKVHYYVTYMVFIKND
jgi:hypothetical protein